MDELLVLGERNEGKTIVNRGTINFPNNQASKQAKARHKNAVIRTFSIRKTEPGLKHPNIEQHSNETRQ